MLMRSRQDGDTLIEVMLAVTILSVVTLGGFSIMNKGTGVSLGVLERTETRGLVTQQLELISYIRDQYAQSIANGNGATAYPASLWPTIRNKAIASDSAVVNATAPNQCSSNANSFFIEKNPDTTYKISNYTTSTPQTTPKPGNGLWVEAVASPVSVSVSYVDFYIKACWDAVVGGEKEMISSTARLYDR